MDSSSADKLNLSAPVVGKSRRSSKEKNEFENILKFEEMLNCSADTALRYSKTSSKSSNKKLSFLERQKKRFKLLEGTTQKITYSQKTENLNISKNSSDSKSTDKKSKSHNVKPESKNIKTKKNESKNKDGHLKSDKQIGKEQFSDSEFKIPISPSVKKTESKMVEDRTAYTKTSCNKEFKECAIDFQTGSGKKIEISERALKRASKIFDDIDLSPNGTVDQIYQLNISNRFEKNNQLELNENILKNKLSEWGNQEIKKVNSDSKKEIENKGNNTNEKIVHKVESSDNVKELNQQCNTFVSPSASPSTRKRYGNKRTKNTFNSSAIASPNNKSFTQVSDTQMCWVAENAECLVEATDSQWHSEYEIKEEMSEDGFEDLSTQEVEFLKNISFSTQSNNSFKQVEIDTEIEDAPTQTLNNFCGYNNNEIDEALKLSQIYCRSTNYIKTDVNKKKFFPISFIFEDVKLNLQQTKKVSTYSLRSSQCKSPASQNLRVRKKSTRYSEAKFSKEKKENILKSSSKNSKKRILMDTTLTPKTEENFLNETFINELGDIPVTVSPAGKRSKISKSNLKSTLSSTNSNKSSSENIIPKDKKSRKNGKTSKHIPESNNSQSSSINTDDSNSLEKEKNEVSIKMNNSDEIYDAPTQIYKPPDISILEPELFEGYDLFEEETLTSTAPENIEITSNIGSAKDNQDNKRKNNSLDELNSTDKKRMKTSNEEKHSTKKAKHYHEKNKETSNLPVKNGADKKENFECAEASENVKKSTETRNKTKLKTKIPSKNCEKSSAKSNVKDNIECLTESNKNIQNPKKVLRNTTKEKMEVTTHDFGFTTAAGKTVQVSEKALQQAKKLFSDCENDTDYFQDKTGSEISSTIVKKIENSSDTIHKPNKLKEQLEISTGSIKRPQGSEEVIQKEKNILVDCEDENIPNFGFSTAAGKKIKVSEAALKRAKALFADCQDVQHPNHSEVTENKVQNSNGDTMKAKIQISEPNTSKNMENISFATAAGKKLEVSEAALEKAKTIFTDCQLEDAHSNDSNINKQVKLPSSDRKSTEVFDDSEQKSKRKSKYENDKNFPKVTKSMGFATAAGKKIDVFEEALQKAKALFADCENWKESNSSKINETEISEDVTKVKEIFTESEESKISLENKSMGFFTAGGKEISISKEALQKAKKMFEDCEDKIYKAKLEDNKNFGFSTAGGKTIQISDVALQHAKNIFADIEENPSDVNSSKNKEIGFATAGGKNIKVSEESLKRAKEMFSDCNLTEEFSDEDMQKVNVLSSGARETKSFCRKLEDTFTESKNVNLPEKKLHLKPNANDKNNTQIANESTPVMQNRVVKNISSTKRLGISSCRQINISENSLKKAKLIFEDIDSPQSIKSFNMNNSFGQYSSTPLKSLQPCTPKSVSYNTPQSVTSLSTTITANDSTLISDTSKTMQKSRNFNDSSLLEELSDSFSKFNFIASQNTSIEDRKSIMMKEFELTKMKVSVLETRMRMFENQQELLKNKPPEYKRLIPGHLYKLKTKSKRRSTLKEAVEDERPGKLSFQAALTCGVSPSVLEVTPENATKLNFFVPWWPNAQRIYPPVIRTEDKTIIIPNESNNIGLNEIEPAFLTTPGIDATLLPRGWVENHFRWIVWKLASMERSFPDKFSDCLTVENVVSQLKYRYDREIDRAQRPAVRKILERDDIAGRRLVLCVATIIKLPNQKHELELTDGWYSIKASIDSALNALVERGVIKIGLKLMLHGAELSSCEPCHPLDMADSVRLQIYYNSTRRAAWYAKLGYQQNPGPFCINLRTINSNGGPVSCVSAYVARVYPVSYMERLESSVVWRNIKAEQRCATEWETKQTYVLEHLQQRVQEEIEKEWIEQTRNQKKNIKHNDIKSITCPKTLYQILQTSNDPDSIQEAMTPSQCLAVQDYARKFTALRQESISSRLRELMAKEKIKNRDVCSVLKLLLVDVHSPYHSKYFSIWRPKESHFQELKEGNVVRMYNIAVKNNGALSSVPRTQFQVDLKAETIQFEHMERKVTPISEMLAPNFKPIFNEFDTAGMVVYVDIEQLNQTIWLADENSSFLMIKVTEGPETCLFEGIALGNIVSVTNLIFKKRAKLYTEATANHYTVFSIYPNQSYLQHFLKTFIEHMPTDTDKYLDECKDNVEVFLAQNAMQSSLLNMSFNTSQVEEVKSRICGINPMMNDPDTLTLSDEELSSIDTQNYLRD